MTPSLLRLAALLGPLAAAVASPLTEPTAVHVRADAAAPAITVLKVGTVPAPAAGAAAPAGWLAIELPGPHEVYVQNKDITKSLDVRPGAELRSAPKADATVVTVAAAGEKLDITGLQGRWTQLRLNRPLIGFIRAPGAAPASPLPPASVPAAGPRGEPAAPAAPVAPPPAAPTAFATAPAGQPAPAVSLGDPSAALPRTFQGRFVSTRSPLRPRRPYDWALTDETGNRFAYLDVTRLLQTERIENYTGRVVAVFGSARPVPGTKDFVIVVESLQLR